MPLVRFKATADLPRWQHSKVGVKVVATHGDGTTTKVRGDGVLRDQDVVEMDDFQASWATSIHPDNFEVVTDDEDLVDPDWVNPGDYLKDDLLDLAEERDVDVNTDMTKAEIADAINQDSGGDQ